ncbi:MAG: phenylalanine--tRNA ligase subunit beta, partial [Bacteroidales bacterium]|nr:phenylalanine--tRNA ligase subunit beta [Bacteroidales bacterium]
MKISYNWLKQYIDTDLDPQEVSEILTNTGLEVEGLEEVQSVKGGLEGVVIGEVLSCEKHPDADKLTVCTVSLGESEPVQIVCGAPNVATGQKVPVATVGATLWPDEKGFTIKKAKIRGALSMGMICAEDELGLGNSHDGIMVLDPEALPGTPAAEYFQVENDYVFEIGLTPNRIDGASHIGVARDLAAFLKQSRKVNLVKPSVEGFKSDNNKLYIPIEIKEKAGCKRYSGLTFQDIKVTESPTWLQNRLRSIGQTPINNVVDITNFVLHETGQPLHAFDAAQITGNKVIVRTMPEGTPFVTLDEQERKLRSSDLMICNAEEGGMCIAGVFGGIKSGVTEVTTDIFLESACFDPVYIRKTARHHQLNTDASFRFERGSDPNMTVWALKRAALMIKEIAGGTISSELVDVYPEPVEDFRIEISYAHVDRLIGNHLDPATIRSILESLEIRVEEEHEQGMVLRVPPYRVDVQREADVIEEILRIYGFNRVEITNGLRSTLSSTTKPDKELVVNMSSDLLSAKGFFEMKSNSLTPASYYDMEETDPAAVRLFNPLSQDLSLMRQNLLFGGLEAIAYNINRKQTDLKLYEFGNCYFLNGEKKGDDPLEKYDEAFHMGIFLSGNVQQGNWIQKSVEASFNHLKTYVEMVLIKLGIDPMALECKGSDNPNYDEALVYLHKNTLLVEFGRVAKSAVKSFDIKQQVFAAEFNWDLVLNALAGHRILFKTLPKFQVVTRDFSLMLDRSVTFEALRTLAFQAEKKLLKKVTLFDVYEGDKIEKGKKSYALTFTLLDEDKTLTDKQIDKAM